MNELAIEPGAPVQLLHQRILVGDRQLATPEPIGSPALALGSAAEPPVVHGLPPADPAFTGREDELAEIDRLLRAAPPGAFVALAGQPGVGKTALAVAAAHHSADAFPHGQLFLDLRPEPGRRLEPAAAISALLRRAGAPVPAGGDPADLHEALQQLLAGRRLLLVLDNVSSEAQLRPLLPTSAGSSAIVTGRRLWPVWTGCGRWCWTCSARARRWPCSRRPPDRPGRPSTRRRWPNCWNSAAGCHWPSGSARRS
ncbi:AAA family ATPase [Kitasatospora gansuensis]